MQDTSTGLMVPVNQEIEKAFLQGMSKTESDRIQQFHKDAAIPNRAHQGPLFTVGEELEIRGGKFRVQAITEKRIYLDSLPS